MSKQSQSRKSRKASGNMIIFVCVVMALFAVGIVIAASFAGVGFAHNRLQAAADEIALSGARKLNENDRLGQMNDLIARSRQLVFSMNQANDQVKNEVTDPTLTKFADQLEKEAQDNGRELDKERHYLSGLAKDEAQKEMQDKFDQIKNGYAMILPWLRVDMPKELKLETGTIKGMQSSARELDGVPELVQQDNANVIDAKPVNLYRAGQDAQLQNVADCPHYVFSPLPAAVVNNLSPARAVLPETFETVKGDYAPCATHLELALKVQTGLGPQGAGEFKVTSAAAATGGTLF